jgi:long-chain acyl-CoA synthetase
MPAFTYHRDAEKRAEMECDGLVTCGDLGYLDEGGYLHIVDRRTDLILCGGVNVYPAEIERQLAMLPGVGDCAVVGLPDPDLGRVPVAFVQPESGVAFDLEAVRDHLAANLARTKLPWEIRLVDALPRDETGKVRHRNLANLL